MGRCSRERRQRPDPGGGLDLAGGGGRGPSRSGPLEPPASGRIRRERTSDNARGRQRRRTWGRRPRVLSRQS